MGNSNLRPFGLLLLAALSLPISAASAAGKAYVFLGGKIGNLSACRDQLSVHMWGDSGPSDVEAAVKRTKSGETIVVAGHSDGSIFATKFIKAVKAKDAQAKIKYINFDGFRPNGGGRPDIGSSNLTGIQGLEITCVTMLGAPNYPYLRNGPGCKTVVVPVQENCTSWCRHYAVMNCSFLK